MTTITIAVCCIPVRFTWYARACVRAMSFAPTLPQAAPPESVSTLDDCVHERTPNLYECVLLYVFLRNLRLETKINNLVLDLLALLVSYAHNTFA